MKTLKAITLLAIFIGATISIYFVFNMFIEKNFQGQDGVLDIQRIEKQEVINVNGEFLVVDGILTPEKMSAYVKNEQTLEAKVKRLTYNEIRQYNFSQDSITAYMKIRGDLSHINGLIIEEIYSAANVFVNGTLVASSGNISEEGHSILMAKESKLVQLKEAKEFEIVMQISNPEHIGGQLEKHLFIGDYNALFKLWNYRLLFKSVHSIFYCTMGLVLLGLFIRNQKHLFLLTLGIAGILNGYIILTYFEPFTIFTPRGSIYIINSYLQAFPTLVTQFLSALSIILYIKKGKVYEYLERFVPITLLLLILGIIYVIFAQQSADEFYLVLLFAVMTFMLYALILLGKTYLLGEQKEAYLYIAFMTYILSYGLLISISLSNYSFGILSQYPILLMTGQFAFYLMMSYFIITDFSRQFYLTEINENYLEEVVQEKTKQLTESLRLLEKEDASRRQLLSDISHDLRSPITVVKGYIELINAGKIEKDRQEHYMDIILKKVNYIGDLVENILYLARVEQGKSTAKDIEALDLIISEVVDTCQYHSHKIQCELTENMQLECDYGQIKRLFVNLIDNAIDYSPEGSTVYIRGKIEDSRYLIEIQDKGIGIDNKYLEQIFNRFVRVDATRNNDSKHFGLGLAIVKSIVAGHGGTIQCESVVGEGTTFTICFPMKRGE
ncbi:sensor histidine kinase [Anaerovorax odorimutans]|uniref:sensor histidine kinase n=1 Tax=Anaerovorax odorimutans TaxID=109327 RepID=UPI00041A2EF2|nr:HAMP domain-containing sensor histidine kinase [Anaerovorax odorimutans]